MEHNTNRILWTVLVLAIGVALYVGFKGPANGLLHQVVDKTHAVIDNTHGSASDHSTDNATAGTNLYTDTQNFNNPASWWNYYRCTKITDTYKGLAVMQTTCTWGGLGQHIHVKKGDVLTYSAYVRYTSGTGTGYVYWIFNNQVDGTDYEPATANPTANTVTITDSWQRVSGTTVATSDGYLRPLLDYNDDNNTLQIAGIKVEKGNNATPYTP